MTKLKRRPARKRRARWSAEIAHTVLPYIEAVVGRKRTLFHHYQGQLGREDLIQEGLVVVQQKYHRFRPEKASLKTFVNRLVTCRLLDIYRRRECRARHEGLFATFQKSIAPPPDQDPASHPPLDEWLQAVRLAGDQFMTDPCYRQGRRGFTIGQSIAVGALMHRMKLSIRGAREWFELYPEMQAAVGFKKLPSEFWFTCAREVIAQFLKKFSASQIDDADRTIDADETFKVPTEGRDAARKMARAIPCSFEEQGQRHHGGASGWRGPPDRLRAAQAG